MILFHSRAIDLVVLLAIGLVVLSVCYLLGMIWLSRRRPALGPAGGSLPYDSGFELIFLIPCLNERRVLGASLDHLLALDHPRMHIIVIDDGSDDGTADLVRNHSDSRVRLVRRELPEARQGKGHALNAALRFIAHHDVVPAAHASETIVVVLDADGRLDGQTLPAVLPRFHDPSLAGVQVGVRINNRHSNLLARMQDFEFVLYTEVFQRGRQHVGTVGLGGNGQFVRLSALLSLGPSPWSDSLCEDLDLGVRLLLADWQLEFCPTAAVHQQGLVDLRRWLRQRTRWFQGHLQSWRLVPDVLHTLRGKTRADLYFHLTSPFLLLSASFLSVAFFSWVLGIGLNLMTGSLVVTWMWASAYLFAVGPALLLGLIYRRVEREAGHDFSLLRCVLLVHCYVAYGMLWYIAGWRALWRSARGHRGWVKTDRLREGADRRRARAASPASGGEELPTSHSEEATQGHT